MGNVETWERERQSDEEAAARYGNPYVCEVRGGWWRSYWMMPNLQWCLKSFRTEAQARAHSATKHNPRRLGPRSAWTGEVGDAEQ